MPMRYPYLHEFTKLMEIEAESFSEKDIWEPEVYLDILASGGECWVITEGLGSDKIVGQIWVQPMDEEGEPDVLEVVSLSVSPEARRRGFAKQMMESVVNYADTNLMKSVSLHVREDNTAARILYEKLGFSVFKRVKKYYTDKSDAIVYRKDLTK